MQLKEYVLHEFDDEDDFSSLVYVDDTFYNWLTSTINHKEWINTNTSSLGIYKDDDTYMIHADMTETNYAEYLLIFK
jgi:hypothetical protein|tara:strand:- start:499 stop:729 length:231 start_codon:yes stop_codon:yes gene_type:complete